MDGLLLRKLMGCFVTGVAVITTKSQDGPYGLTINSLTSLSLNPPLILFCLDKGVGGHDLFRKGEYFGVNILSLEQEEVSRIFAKKGVSDRFLFVPWEEGPYEVPLLHGCIVNMLCQVEALFPGGDHTIVIGKVLEGRQGEGKKPLVFFQGTYQQLAIPQVVDE